MIIRNFFFVFLNFLFPVLAEENEPLLQILQVKMHENIQSEIYFIQGSVFLPEKFESNVHFHRL